ncbi:hypothetical protein J3A78_000016 [Streptomyces sp. PvR006]|nr:hypothetical protein [Streptomyces sp. PvR006]
MSFKTDVLNLSALGRAWGVRCEGRPRAGLRPVV